MCYMLREVMQFIQPLSCMYPRRNLFFLREKDDNDGQAHYCNRRKIPSIPRSLHNLASHQQKLEAQTKTNGVGDHL